MKATLTFNLPDDKYEYDLAMSAGRLQSAIHEYSMYLRAIDKYGAIPPNWMSDLLDNSEEFDKERAASLNKLSKEDIESIMLFVVSKLRTQFYEELSSEGVSDI